MDLVKAIHKTIGQLLKISKTLYHCSRFKFMLFFLFCFLELMMIPYAVCCIEMLNTFFFSFGWQLFIDEDVSSNSFRVILVLHHLLEEIWEVQEIYTHKLTTKRQQRK